MRKTLKIVNLVKQDLEVGDLVRLIDGSSLSLNIKNPSETYYIIKSYFSVTGNSNHLEEIECKVLKVDIEDCYIEGAYESLYKQDILIKVGAAEFRTHSSMVKKINKLPKTFEELKEIKGVFINAVNRIVTPADPKLEANFTNSNTIPTLEHAKAIQVLPKLLQLMLVYNDGWTPDYNDNTFKFSIIVQWNRLTSARFKNSNSLLAFKTAELRDTFFENFKDDLEIVKILL